MYVKKSKNKYTGCMLGAAIGDALGKQNEGLSRKEIPHRVTDYGKPLKEGRAENSGRGNILMILNRWLSCRNL